MSGERPVASVLALPRERPPRTPFTSPAEAERDRRSRFVRALQWIYAWTKGSPWTKPIGKGLLAALALGLLAALGGSALAGAKDANMSAGTGPPASAAPATTVLAETVIEAPRAGSSGNEPANVVPDGGGGVPIDPAHPPSPAGAAGKATPENPVSLNSATFEDLRRLPGIGPKKAEAILALRTKLGKFKRPEDLMRVKGIGRGTFKKLRPLVRVDD